jgi:tRNA dimethylallyltransferase
MTRAVLIAGPTASGKSALALALAERLQGVVINADSMQVYRDLRVLTARPMATEEAKAPHRLYGYVDAAEDYSVGRWLADAALVLREVQAAGRVPIFTGGTGLYFKALTRGLAAIPPVPREVRQRIRSEAEGVPAGELHARLAAVDARTAARLRSTDRQRIVRALEVHAATGRGLSAWQDSPAEPVLKRGGAVAAFLQIDRAELRRRIDTRFDAMLNAGALEEVRALAARKLDQRLPAMKAHGVPWLMRHLRGEISLTEAASGAKADTRRYAKRQETWFRHQLPDWRWIEAGRALEVLSAELRR